VGDTQACNKEVIEVGDTPCNKGVSEVGDIPCNKGIIEVGDTQACYKELLGT
jgi:hypothetical protein